MAVAIQAPRPEAQRTAVSACGADEGGGANFRHPDPSKNDSVNLRAWTNTHTCRVKREPI